MQHNDMTIRSYLEQSLPVPLGAIPLSMCQVLRPYLLERAGLSMQGTAFLFAVPYVLSQDASHPQRNVSLYAIPRDYHLFFKTLEAELLPKLQEFFPTYHFALFADHSPIHEVNAAARCGLGVVGMNGLLLHKIYGSFIFLAEIITDAPFEVAVGHDASMILQDDIPTCRGCGACIHACPAACLPDHRQGCLSALTQKKGQLSPEEIEQLSKHDLVWGCDTCQMVCPYNKLVLKKKTDTPIPYFRELRCVNITAEDILAMSEKEFAQRAYAWRGKDVILRNLEIKNIGKKGDIP